MKIIIFSEFDLYDLKFAEEFDFSGKDSELAELTGHYPFYLYESKFSAIPNFILSDNYGNLIYYFTTRKKLININLKLALLQNHSFQINS